MERTDKIKKFLTDTETWCNEFIQKNESTIIASSYFYDYIYHFNLIGHIIDSIYQPVNVTEEDFLYDQYNNAMEYLQEKKVLDIDDQRAVKEFINNLFDNVKDFYEGNIHTEDIATFYTLKQTMLRSIKYLMQLLRLHKPQLQAFKKTLCLL